MYFGIATNCLVIFQALCLGHLPLTAETQRSEGDVAMLFDEGFHPFSALALQVGMYWFPALVMHLLSSFLPHQGRLGCIWFSIIRLGLICLDKWAECDAAVLHLLSILSLLLTCIYSFLLQFI